MTTDPDTTDHPEGATLHLGGRAWAHPDLTDALVPVAGGRAHSLTTDDPPALTPYPGNPRRGDQPAITASLRDLGLYRPVIAQRTTGHVLAGNHTFRALLDLGAERVPVTWVDVSDTRAAALVARDNHTSDRARNDDAELLALLTADEEVLALSGMDDHDLDALRRAVENHEFARGAADALGIPAADATDPIDLDGDAEKVTVTLDPGHRTDLYAILNGLDYVRNVTNAHTRTTDA